MTAHKIAMRSVVRVDVSPMNPKRWCAQLSCGHEVWVTAKQKPKRKVMSCSTCVSS